MPNIYRIRRINLRKIRDAEYKGSTQALANKLAVATQVLSRYIANASKARRDIRDRTARLYEERLGLDAGSLDNPDGMYGTYHTYYVVLQVENRHVPNVIRWLQKFEEIKEACATFGGMDIIVKIQVDEPHLLEIVIGEIGRYPGVVRTDTHLGIQSLHWQREQPEIMREIENSFIPAGSENYAEQYIKQRIKYHFEQIEHLEKGEVSSHDRLAIGVDRVRMIGSAKKEILAISLKNDPTKQNSEYFEAEKACTDNGVKSRRIIILKENNKENYHQYFKDIRTIYQKLIAINCNVKFLSEKHWSQSDEAPDPIDFLIIDSGFVYVRQQRKGILKRQDIQVNVYKGVFESNWSDAVSFDELEDIHFKYKRR